MQMGLQGWQILVPTLCTEFSLYLLAQLLGCVGLATGLLADRWRSSPAPFLLVSIPFPVV